MAANETIPKTGTSWPPPNPFLKHPIFNFPGKIIETETSSLDHWTISFIDSSGKQITGSCTCAVDAEDGGQNVVVSLSSDHYAINTPTSDPCTDKSYN